MVEGKQFIEQPPAKDWNETLARTQHKFENISNQAEKKLMSLGEKVEKKFEEKGWKNKMEHFFMKKLKMEKFGNQLDSQREVRRSATEGDVREVREEKEN
mmetsp:Transcript_14685/g.10583  ORF Transcript_14685/g.10583 Transcript_14685/m.10583 type:complete len:100 (+) Transcript_14685:538-837(+)|eukprot:CAMPEP_0202957222 /NCGR_PEP_ID=MMETSP1396-20130829/1661_1 /ASSEMBLY_ACC=CAM_ASM_000872 /TAXON_ID= /ORGANISM="Pseudokeronopsis sp., Strain Brazil" /LENGTH=99 /DNA_ID=CAMNT_0049674609 /DNA_START=520 /DNA_END=819 /DNA_ORIENTATION=+